MDVSDSGKRSAFRKSSYSGSHNDACVEVAGDGAGLLVRDSKDPEGGTLALDPVAARRLLAMLRG
ncbi:MULTISPECIES: DUF397 domain-containing protein [unclassified Actinomadura]|uniref:DUF397 domain-containing protein n=1 Tax=unclassified Actinomadura TaxID=2626254 RepID=UPI00135A5D5B|nr:DUF397 domain-containing protein [Actinomadura sp. K4S16]